MGTKQDRAWAQPQAASVTSDEARDLLHKLESVAKEAGIKLDFEARGNLFVQDLGFDIGFSNTDCNGVCSNNCSGCSACSGCSGCSTTNTVKASLDLADLVSLDPISRFLTDLRTPAIQEALQRSAPRATASP